MNIFYWDKRSNFGDALGKKAMLYYGHENVFNIYQNNYDGDYISPIGSVLHFAPREGLHIFGSGFMSDKKTGSKKAPQEVITLRGPLSAEIAAELGWPAPKALGDTGLLASRIYPKTKKIYTLGVVLHYAHAIEKIPNIPGVLFIDPLDDVDKVIRDISSCEKILSSSLHGLIVAHSFEIPWVRLKVIDHELGGGDFKFNDFYGSINCPDPAEVECFIGEVKLDVFSIIERSEAIGVDGFSDLKKLQIKLESAFYNSSYFLNILKPLL